MKERQEERRARLLAAAEAAIDELMMWEATHKEPNLTQIEEEALRLREGFGRAIVAAELAGQEAQQPGAGVTCPVCGEEMRYKGRKRKVVESRAGEVAIERGYYYCPACKQGIFPPGQAVGAGGTGLE